MWRGPYRGSWGVSRDAVAEVSWDARERHAAARVSAIRDKCLTSTIHEAADNLSAARRGSSHLGDRRVVGAAPAARQPASPAEGQDGRAVL